MSKFLIEKLTQKIPPPSWRAPPPPSFFEKNLSPQKLRSRSATDRLEIKIVYFELILIRPKWLDI